MNTLGTADYGSLGAGLLCFRAELQEQDQERRCSCHGEPILGQPLGRPNDETPRQSNQQRSILQPIEHISSSKSQPCSLASDYNSVIDDPDHAIYGNN